MVTSNQVVLPAKLENLPHFNQLVTDTARQQDLPEGKAAALELAFEEALVNIINHAYPDGEGDILVACLKDPDKGFTIRIEDSGPPFDPLQMDSPDTTLGIEERAIGGLGIHLIKKFASDLDYQRAGGKNVLTLRKRIELDSPAS